MKYIVRKGYVVHLKPGHVLMPGDKYVSTGKKDHIVAGQSWKLEPVIEASKTKNRQMDTTKA